MVPTGTGDDAGRATSGLTSTGTLDSGPGGVPSVRRRVLLGGMACGALLAVGLVVHQQAGSGLRPAPAAHSAAPRVSGIGPSGVAIDSDTGSARVVVAGAQRVPSGSSRPSLEIVFRVDVRSGFQTLTTESFAVSDPGGATRFRASSLTVVRPGAQIVPADSGFRIPAPSSVEVDVLLDVPAGEHVVSVLGPADDRPLATFAVTG